MSDLRAQWRTIESRFGRFTPKERALVSLACAALLYVAVDALFLAPAQARRKKAAEETIKKSQEGDKLMALLTDLAAKQSFDPDALNRRRLQELQSQAEVVQGALREQSALMVPADEMPKLLERLLANHPRLELVSLKTLPPVEVDLVKAPKPAAGAEVPSRAATPSETPPDSATGVYRYGLDLAIKGGYLDLLEYLRDIESLTGRIYWDRMDLSVTEFPLSTLKLTLSTLSFDRAWMKV